MQGPLIRSPLESPWSLFILLAMLHGWWDLRSNLGPWQSKCQALTTGLPRNSLSWSFKCSSVTPGPVRKLSPRKGKILPRAPTKLGRVRRGAHLPTCCPRSSSRQHKVGGGGGAQAGSCPSWAGPCRAAALLTGFDGLQRHSDVGQRELGGRGLLRRPGGLRGHGVEQAGGTGAGQAAAAFILQVPECEPGGWLLLLPYWGDGASSGKSSMARR